MPRASAGPQRDPAAISAAPAQSAPAPPPASRPDWLARGLATMGQPRNALAAILQPVKLVAPGRVACSAAHRATKPTPWQDSEDFAVSGPSVGPARLQAAPYLPLGAPRCRPCLFAASAASNWRSPGLGVAQGSGLQTSASPASARPA